MNNSMLFKKKTFKVKMRGRSGVIYEEGVRCILIDAEMMIGTTDLVIYADSLQHWQPPYDAEVITPDDKRRIISNITNELESKGLNIDWEYLNLP
jgi:hypothetical protein